MLFRNRFVRLVIGLSMVAVCVGFAAVHVVATAEARAARAEQVLRIDVPAKVDAANVVFNVAKLELNGDMPFALGHLGLLAGDFRNLHTRGKIVAIFHTEAGHVVLNDSTYNAERHVATGNPYKDVLADLMKQGVEIQLCGATATAHHWGNADLLPGVKVNTDAMITLTQLGKEGYVEITE